MREIIEVLKHPTGLLAVMAGVALILKTGGVLFSSLWYSIRRNRFPGLETAKLPRWGQYVQAYFEWTTNYPGADNAISGRPAGAPGTSNPPAEMHQPAQAALAPATSPDPGPAPVTPAGGPTP